MYFVSHSVCDSMEEKVFIRDTFYGKSVREKLSVLLFCWGQGFPG